jgi:hypothetical protein
VLDTATVPVIPKIPDRRGESRPAPRPPSTPTDAIRTLGANPATAPIVLHPGDAIPTRRRVLYIVLLGALTALGGYKGFGIAFMIEVLAAVLTGSSISNQVLSWTFSEPNTHTGHGAAFMAINIESFMPIDSFKQRMDHLIAEIHSAPRAEHSEHRLYSPGELEFSRREKALKDGIDLPDDVTASLKALAQDLNLSFPPS